MYLRILILVALFVLLGALTPTDLRPESTLAQGNAGANIVLLMDHSFSLKETDPEEFRLSAAQLFLQLLDPSRDRVAIVTFARDTEEITCGAPDSTTCFSSDAAYLQQELASEAGNNSIEDQGGTDLLAGLQAAYMLLDNRALPDDEAFIVLLTDGAPCNPGPPIVSSQQDPEYSGDIIDLVLENSDVASIYALSFASPDVAPAPGTCREPDRALMEDISRITGGWARHESSPEGIPDLYTQILTRIRDLNIVLVEREESLVPPATDVIIATIVGDNPRLDANSGAQSVVISTCTALPVQENINARRSCLDLQRDRALVVIIDGPSTGAWQFDTGGAGTIRVLAETAWGVSVAEPSEGQRFPEGSEIPVRVEIIDVDGRVLADLRNKVGAVLLDSSQDRRSEVDLAAVDGSPADFVGVFSQAPELLPGEEEAQLLVAPQITGLEVSFSSAVGIVIEPIPTIVTIRQPGETAEFKPDGDDGVLLAVDVEKDAGEAVTDASVVAEVVGPDGRTRDVTLVGGEDGRYEGRLFGVAEEGPYDLTFNVTLADGKVVMESQTTQMKEKPGPKPPWLIILLATLAIIAAVVSYSVFFVPRFPKEAALQIGRDSYSLRTYSGRAIFRAQRIVIGQTWPFDLELPGPAAEVRASRSGDGAEVISLGDLKLEGQEVEGAAPLYYNHVLSGEKWSMTYVRQDPEDEL